MTTPTSRAGSFNPMRNGQNAAMTPLSSTSTKTNGQTAS
jgi:hypothetical protein